MHAQRTTRRGFTAAALFFLLPAILQGCAAPRVVTPDDLLRTDIDPERRLADLDRLGPVAQFNDPAGYAATLERVVVSDDQPDALRLAAIDRLLTYDERRLHDVLAEHLPVIDRWAVIERVCELAAERRWDDFVPVLIVSYARPAVTVDDDHRPERGAIMALRPQHSVEQSVFEVFDAPADDAPGGSRAAAWALLCRWDDPRPRLERATSDALLVMLLQQASHVLDELPRTQQGCTMLVFAQLQPDWDAHAAAIPGLALRHLALFSDATPQPDPGARVAGRTHVVRSERAERDPAWTEDYAAQQDQLSAADRALVNWVLDAMDDRAIVDAWFAQGDADYADDATEHGGLLLKNGDAYEAVAYPSDTAAHDREFVASPQMLMRLAQGGVLYHYHAQKYHNGEFAGPGQGDLTFVERFEVAAVVLTFIDHDTLNVDYYQPNGAVIDLGCVTR